MTGTERVCFPVKIIIINYCITIYRSMSHFLPTYDVSVKYELSEFDLPS